MQSKLILPFITVAISLLSLSGIAVSQQLKTPLLTFDPPRLVFDTTFCNTTKCATLVFRNTGDTVLEVSSADAVEEPFAGPVPVPFSLQPGQTREVEFCFTPAEAPSVDSQRVGIIADTRVSNSFALCLDVSANMLGELEPGMSYFDALDSTGKILIRSFLNNETVHDECAVYWYKEASAFLSVRNFTDNQAALISALPDTGFGSDACVYDGLSKTLNGITTARNQKVVVLVSASQDAGAGTCGPVSRPAVISLANSIGARVFTIGMGSADPASLTDISSSTGGRYYRVDSFQDFVDAFEDITNAISQDVAVSFVLRGRGVAPVIELSPKMANFYSVETGEESCMPLQVRNTGDAPLQIKSVSALTAPFSMNGTLPGVILPGEEATVELCAKPVQRGFASTHLNITGNGCTSTAVSLPLRVVGYDLTGEAHGAVLAMTPSAVDFDTSYCGVRKCQDITFTNTGDTTVYIRSLDSLVPPFTGSLTMPFAVQPNQTVRYNICYYPENAPREDALDVSVVADTRVPLSTAMLIDVSASMSANQTTDGIPLIAAVNNAAADFLSNLLDHPQFSDEAAVYSFGDVGDFTLLQDFSTGKDVLTAALPQSAEASTSCLYDALEQTIAHLAPRTKRKVLIVVTDGFDVTGCGSATPQSVIDAAVAANVSIWPVGIGFSDTTILGTLAAATGGAVMITNLATDAVDVMRDIGNLLSTGIEHTIALHGRGVSASMVLDPEELLFGEVKVGSQVCKEIMITNQGDAPLVVEPVADQNPQFVIQNHPIEPILPGTTYPLEICFIPERLRTQTAEYIFESNSCGQEPTAVHLEGVAWDSVVVYLEGEWSGKPGSHMQIPIMVENRIPEHYDITQYTLTLEYDKTLLYPDEQPVITTGTMSASMKNVSDSVSFDPDGRIRISLSGGQMISAAPNGILVKLGFTALLGSSKSTELRLVEVAYENDIPRVGLFSDAVFSTDSICYLDERLIDASARYMTTLKQNVPNPFNPVTNIAYRVANGCNARLAVYSMLGSEVRVLADGWHKKGEYVVQFNAAGLESGLYFYRLITPQTTLTRKMLFVK